MIEIAGIPFDVSPPERVRPIESEYLSTLHHVSACDSDPFVIELVDAFRSPSELIVNPGGPQTLCSGSTIVLDHPHFRTTIDTAKRHAVLERYQETKQPLYVTLRVATAAALPFQGGIVLHAASAVVHDHAVVFFGQSGIGKSTLMKLSPHPVISDEWVALRPAGQGFIASGTPFWSSYMEEKRPTVTGSFPLAFAAALAQGDSVDLAPITSREMARRLLNVAIVPAADTLWDKVLSILGRVAESVPGYRLSWPLASPPWREVERTVAQITSSSGAE